MALSSELREISLTFLSLTRAYYFFEGDDDLFFEKRKLKFFKSMRDGLETRLAAINAAIATINYKINQKINKKLNLGCDLN